MRLRGVRGGLPVFDVATAAANLAILASRLGGVFEPGHRWQSLKRFAARFAGVFLLNLFIWKRSPSRAAAHLLIMWG